MNKLLYLALYFLGVGTTGFGTSYISTTLINGPTTIKDKIKDTFGYSLISESTHKDALYKSIFKKEKDSIVSSGLIAEITKDTADSNGIETLSKWCDQKMNEKITSSNKDLAEKVIKWCYISKTVRHKLINKGNEIIEEVEDGQIDSKYDKVYEDSKSDDVYKQLVLEETKNGNQLTTTIDSKDKARPLNKKWCQTTLNYYADEGEDTEAYKRAEKWCATKKNT